jgi:hypothetical protein
MFTPNKKTKYDVDYIKERTGPKPDNKNKKSKVVKKTKTR